MQVNLKVLDRIMLGVMFPGVGSYLEMATIRSVKERVQMSPEELKAVSFKDGETGGVFWDKAADVGKDIDFPVPEWSFVIKTLKDLDEKKQLTPDHLGLYEAFVTRPYPVIPFTTTFKDDEGDAA